MKIFAVTIFLALCSVDLGYCCSLRCNDDCKTPKEFAKECVAKKKAYVASGIGPVYGCSCCGQCADVKDVVEPSLLKGCNRNKCKSVKHAAEDVKKCTKSQVYVPRDGSCFCYAQCAKANPKILW